MGLEKASLTERFGENRKGGKVWREIEKLKSLEKTHENEKVLRQSAELKGLE